MKVVSERDIDPKETLKSITKALEKAEKFTVSVNRQVLIDCFDLINALTKEEA